ncbi:hypothetical protein acdb102_17680 [Acidothermaceae bacterium B102]|nr:hypothetical protein acdb102_17680 [Acidothermaceae bacterium B102]
MTWSLRSTSLRALASVATVLSLVAMTAGPASAKSPARTTISAHLTASTVLVKSTATVTGAVTPAGGSLVLQRLVGRTWTTVAHAKPSRTGAYVFSVRAPKTASAWSLKVIRAASSAAKAGTSATLHLHVVTKQFVVAAAAASTVTSPAATTVTGVVVPAASGTVQVQRLQGTGWIAAAAARRVGAGGTFSVAVDLPPGTWKLRAIKAYTSSVAQGTSATFTVSVSAPVVLAPPTVSTAAIPTARVGVPYATVLTATGGSGFYQWTGTGLPAGLTVSAAGLLAGTPATKGTTSFTVTVTDSAGHAATTSLSLTTAPPAGRLFGVGENTDGEIGNGGNTSLSLFTAVLGMDHVVAAAAGAAASIAVKTDGTVWTWGNNNQGQLGNGTIVASLVPLQVTALSGVTAVTASESNAYALKADGTVWAWGDNMYGEVGDGTTNNRLSPAQVSGLTGVVAISATQNNAYALKSDGTVWGWGYNLYGEVGDGTTTNALSPQQVTGLTGIKAIASGSHNGYALRADGTVAAWGNNQAGELGDGGSETMSAHPVTVLNVSQAVEISGGLNTAYARTANGTVLGWGYNGSSQLGGATASTPSTAVAINVGGAALEVVAGFESAYALLPDHTVVGWGFNSSGQLGNGGTTTGATPTAMKGVTDVVAVVAGGFATTTLLIAN